MLVLSLEDNAGHTPGGPYRHQDLHPGCRHSAKRTLHYV